MTMSAARWMVAAALALAICVSAARAEQPTVLTLVKRLDLVGYRAGTRPPEFSGPTLAARPLSLNDVLGKVTIVNFWATWCAECRPEMPVLEALHRELAPRGLAVVGINARESKPLVARYAQELGLTFPLVLDTEGRNNVLYGVVGLPTTVVIARDGRAVAFGIGPRDWGGAAGRALIEHLLAEPPPRTP